MQLHAFFDATRQLSSLPACVPTSSPCSVEPPPAPLSLSVGLLPELEAAFGELALLHRATEAFGPNYHRARGFAGVLAEALVAPEADVETLIERAEAGRPQRDVLPELSEAFDAGMTLAANVELDQASRGELHQSFGGGLRASVYSQLFRLARQACGSLG
jgi:hypothetical protein